MKERELLENLLQEEEGIIKEKEIIFRVPKNYVVVLLLNMTKENKKSFLHDLCFDLSNAYKTILINTDVYTLDSLYKVSHFINDFPLHKIEDIIVAVKKNLYYATLDNNYKNLINFNASLLISFVNLIKNNFPLIIINSTYPMSLLDVGIYYNEDTYIYTNEILEIHKKLPNIKSTSHSLFKKNLLNMVIEDVRKHL